MTWIAAGPRITTKREGKMQSTSGKSILMAVLAAASSARWRRLVRSVSDSTRSACAIEVPKRSVWMSMVVSARRSSTPVRFPRLRSASSRGRPARISRFTIASSLAISVLMWRTSPETRTIAWFRPNPASTQVTIMSSASGSARRISFCRRFSLRSRTSMMSRPSPAPSRSSSSGPPPAVARRRSASPKAVTVSVFGIRRVRTSIHAATPSRAVKR